MMATRIGTAHETLFWHRNEGGSSYDSHESLSRTGCMKQMGHILEAKPYFTFMKPTYCVKPLSLIEARIADMWLVLLPTFDRLWLFPTKFYGSSEGTERIVFRPEIHCLKFANFVE